MAELRAVLDGARAGRLVEVDALTAKCYLQPDSGELWLHVNVVL